MFLICCAGSSKKQLTNLKTASQYTFESLGLDSTRKYILNISVTDSGDAIIDSSSVPAGLEDTYEIGIAPENQFDSMSAVGNTFQATINTLPQGYKLWWIDIDLRNPPVAYDGGGTITVYCIGIRCGESGKCEPSGYLYDNTANVKCINSCRRCKQKAGLAGGSITESYGGVFLLAKSITIN